MKFKTKFPVNVPVGTVVSITKFAIRPRKIGDTIIWLERYTSEYSYSYSFKWVHRKDMLFQSVEKQ